MFLDQFSAYKTNPKHIAKKYPWADLVDVEAGIVRTKHDGLLVTYRVQPFDLGSLTDDEIGSVMVRLNNAFKRLTMGWAVWLDLHHKPWLPVQETQWTHPVAGLVDEAQLASYRDITPLWTTELYLSLLYQPKPLLSSFVSSLLLTSSVSSAHQAFQRRIEEFKVEVYRFIDVIHAGCLEITPLQSDALLTYLHRLVSEHDQPVRTPAIPTHLDYLLADTPLVGGFRPKLGDDYIFALSLSTLPEDETTANTLRQLLTLPFAYRWVTRWLPMEREDARKDMTSKERNLRSTSKGPRSMVYEMLTKRESRMKNTHVELKADDADLARHAVSSDKVGFGDLTSTFLVKHPDLNEGTKYLRQLERVIHGAGLLTIRERMNSLEAWFGSLAGISPVVNARKLKVNTYNGIHTSAFHTPWAGQQQTSLFNAPPLFRAITEGCMAFGVSLHVDELAHTLVLGPSRFGKSALLSFLACMWRRYPNARVVFLDILKAARATVHCLGGNYFDVGNRSMSFQVLGRVHNPQQFNIAYEWVLDRVENAEGVEFSNNDFTQRYVSGGLRRLAELPQPQRLIRTLITILADHRRGIELIGEAKASRQGATRDPRYDSRVDRATKICSALAPFAQGGEYGYIDGTHDDITTNQVTCFEMAQMMKTPRLSKALESHIWNRIYETFDGSPTLILWDEASEALKNPHRRKRIDRDILMLAKQRVTLVLATQVIEHITDSEIGPTLLQNCLTRILLPNPTALSPKVRPGYEALGLNETEITTIAQAIPKRQYYLRQEMMQHTEGRRLFDLPLCPIAKAVCGSSTPEDQKLIDRVLEDHGSERFAVHWLKAKGFPDEAKRLDEEWV
jgi:type IV secretion system protein TrbE